MAGPYLSPGSPRKSFDPKGQTTPGGSSYSLGYFNGPDPNSNVFNLPYHQSNSPGSTPGFILTPPQSPPHARAPSPGQGTPRNLPHAATANAGHGNIPVQNPVVVREKNFPFHPLWKERILAFIGGAISLTVGILGIMSYVGIGPLHAIFIPYNAFTGRVINGSNIGALVGGIATAFGLAGRHVCAGVARAWLRAKSSEGKGVKIAEWRSLSAGVSMHDIRRTPKIAGGMILVFTVSMAVMGATFVGVAIPTRRPHQISTTYGPIFPFYLNGGIGAQVSCITDDGECSPNFGIPQIQGAFSTGVGGGTVVNESTFTIYSTHVVSDDGFVGGIFLPEEDTRTFGDSIPWFSQSMETPIAIFDTTCEVKTPGPQSVDGKYTYQSDCFGETLAFGNTSIQWGNYILGASCRSPSGQAYTIEIAAAGSYYEPLGSTATVGFSCQVTGREGWGTSERRPFSTTMTLSPTSTLNRLSSLDLEPIATAVLATVFADGAIPDKVGPIGIALSVAMLEPVQLATIMSQGISNAMAAAACYGYEGILAGLNVGYANVIPQAKIHWTEDGFGYPANSPRLLAYSIACALIGGAWLAAGIYMTKGGTVYNPTDWFQTLNISAGSNLQQVQGTCSGAGINAKQVNGEKLYYGVLQQGQIGFAQEQAHAQAIQRKTKY